MRENGLSPVLKLYLDSLAALPAMKDLAVSSVVLIGSYADGTPTRFSDIDVVAVMPRRFDWKLVQSRMSLVYEADRQMRANDSRFMSLGLLDFEFVTSAQLKNTHPLAPFRPVHDAFIAQRRLKQKPRFVYERWLLLFFTTLPKILIEPSGSVRNRRMLSAIVGFQALLRARPNAEMLTRSKVLNDLRVEGWSSVAWEKLYQRLSQKKARADDVKKFFSLFAADLPQLILMLRSLLKKNPSRFTAIGPLSLSRYDYIRFELERGQMGLLADRESNQVVLTEVWSYLLQQSLVQLAAVSEAKNRKLLEILRSLLPKVHLGFTYRTAPRPLPIYFSPLADTFFKTGNRRIFRIFRSADQLKSLHGEWIPCEPGDAEIAVVNLNKESSRQLTGSTGLSSSLATTVRFATVPLWTLEFDRTLQRLARARGTKFFKMQSPQDCRQNFVTSVIGDLKPSAIIDIGGRSKSASVNLLLTRTEQKPAVTVINPDRQCTDELERLRLKSLTVINGCAENLGSFEADLVIATEVFEHLSVKALKKVLRSLNVSPIVKSILISVPNEKYEALPGSVPFHPDHRQKFFKKEFRETLRTLTRFSVVLESGLGGCDSASEPVTFAALLSRKKLVSRWARRERQKGAKNT